MSSNDNQPGGSKEGGKSEEKGPDESKDKEMEEEEEELPPQVAWYAAIRDRVKDFPECTFIQRGITTKAKLVLAPPKPKPETGQISMRFRLRQTPPMKAKYNTRRICWERTKDGKLSPHLRGDCKDKSRCLFRYKPHKLVDLAATKSHLQRHYQQLLDLAKPFMQDYNYKAPLPPEIAGTGIFTNDPRKLIPGDTGLANPNKEDENLQEMMSVFHVDEVMQDAETLTRTLGSFNLQDVPSTSGTSSGKSPKKPRNPFSIEDSDDDDD